MASNNRNLFGDIELFRDNIQDGDRDTTTHILESDEQLESGIDVDATSPNNKNKKPKRANVNWSNKAELELIHLIQFHKAHLKRVTTETQEEKWQNISNKLSQSTHFNGQQLTTGQVQMKWNRLTKRIQDRYSVDMNGSSVCHLPDNPDEITKGIFDILCEADFKNMDKGSAMREKDKKRILFTNSSENIADITDSEILKQTFQMPTISDEAVKEDLSPRGDNLSFRKRPMLKKSRHSSSALASTVPISFTTFSPQQEIPYVFPSLEETNMMSRIQDSIAAMQNVLQYYRSNYGVIDTTTLLDNGDKFVLVEYLTNISLASQLNAFCKLGISSALVSELCQCAKSQRIILRVVLEESYQFMGEVKRQIGSHKSDSQGAIDTNAHLAARVVTTASEFNFLFKLQYRLLALVGSTVDANFHGCHEIMSQVIDHSVSFTARFPPIGSNTKVQEYDLDVTLLLGSIDDVSLQMIFTVDKSDPACKTPRVNKNVAAVLNHCSAVKQWVSKIREFFIGSIHPLFANSFNTHGHLKDISAAGVFNPVASLFFDSSNSPAVSTNISIAAVMDTTSVNNALNQQLKSLDNETSKIASFFPSSNGKALVRYSEVGFLITLDHVAGLAKFYEESMVSVDSMLRQQLLGSVDRIFTAADISEYMRYHNRKLFKDLYRPVSFSYAVRRSAAHAPDGFIRIEESFLPQQLASSPTNIPIETTVRYDPNVAGSTTEVVINTASSIRISGPKYYHSYFAHRFSSSAAPSIQLQLTAESKQYSSFAVLLGRLTTTGTFHPVQGFVIQNTAEVVVPLEATYLPTAKEYKESNTSSPASVQWKISEAYRMKRLQNSIFAICVIQVKPHLEQVLKLPADSLSREIALTQSVIDLFINHQITADHICAEVDSPNYLEAVKSNVAKVTSLLSGAVSADMSSSAPSEASHRSTRADSGETVGDEDAYPSSSSEYSPAMRLSGGIPPHVLVARQPQLAHSSNVEETFTLTHYRLERQFESCSCETVVHPTVLRAGSKWSSRHTDVPTPQPRDERRRCLSLIDALSKSGALVLDKTELHLVMTSTHFVDDSLMDAVISNDDHCNSVISNIERSTLLLASSIHGAAVQDIVAPSELSRIGQTHPALFMPAQSNLLDG